MGVVDRLLVRHVLAGLVVRIERGSAELDLVAVGRAERRLADAGRHVVAAVRHDVAMAVAVVRLRAIGSAGEQIDVLVRARRGEQRAEAAPLVRAEIHVHQRADALARPQHVLRILGAERHHAADRARAVDVGDRTAHHVDLGDELGLEEELAVAVVAGALEVLPRTVDHHRDAAEVLQAADVDRGLRRVGALAEPDARQAVEHVGHALRLDLVELLLAHRAHHRERLDGLLDRLGGQHRDRIERLLRTRGAHAGGEHQRDDGNFTRAEHAAPCSSHP